MYHIEDYLPKVNEWKVDCPRPVYITIGRYRIYERGRSRGKIAIYTDGEGGEFNKKEFEKMIEVFYKKHF